MQRAAEELPNAVAYGSLLDTYSPQELAAAAEETGWDRGYSGHLSGRPGDAVIGTTLRAQQEIAAKARENREKQKLAKKKVPVRQEAAKSDRWKAYNKGFLLMQEVVSGSKDRDAVEEEYVLYLDGKLAANLIDENTWDDCNQYLSEMRAAGKP